MGFYHHYTSKFEMFLIAGWGRAMVVEPRCGNHEVILRMITQHDDIKNHPLTFGLQNLINFGSCPHPNSPRRWQMPSIPLVKGTMRVQRAQTDFPSQRLSTDECWGAVV